MKEEAIAPSCPFEQLEQQLILSVLIRISYVHKKLSKLSNNLIASISFEEHQGFQTI